jgi:hypothetical protein
VKFATANLDYWMFELLIKASLIFMCDINLTINAPSANDDVIDLILSCSSL